MRTLMLARLLMTIIFHIHFANSCQKTTELSGSAEGIIDYPESAETYSPNTDVCWKISIDGSIAIKFLKLDLADSNDWVAMYDDNLPLESKEKFRLSSHNRVAHSEFWLNGRQKLVRFKSDARRQKSRFRLQYRRIPDYALPVAGPSSAIELISGAVHGIVDSHPGLRDGKNYSNNVLQAWSIVAKPDELIRVRFIAFNTDNGFDYLRVFSGAMPNVQIEPVRVTMTGQLEKRTEFNFFGSSTFVFNSDETNHELGFQFTYSIIKTVYSLESVFHDGWIGGPGVTGAAGFTLVATPLDEALETRCQARTECANAIDLEVKQLDSIQLVNSTRRRFLIQPRKGDQSPLHCVGAVTCRVSWKTQAFRTIEQPLDLPNSNPASISIEIVEPQLWSKTGLVQFVATSLSVCPRVKHRCQLKSRNGSALQAKIIKMITSPNKLSSCLRSSIKSLFAVAVPEKFDFTTASIACLLKNGEFLEQAIQSITTKVVATNPSASKSMKWPEQWERKLLVAAWLVAAVAIIVLVAVLVRNARNRRMRHTFISGGTALSTDSSLHRNWQSTAVKNNLSVKLTPIVGQRVNEIYLI